MSTSSKTKALKSAFAKKYIDDQAEDDDESEKALSEWEVSDAPQENKSSSRYYSALYILFNV